jgi:hypothetical protein
MAEIKPFVELQSRATETTTKEGVRFNEVQSVAGMILNQRAEEVCSRMDQEQRGPKSEAEHAYYFFRAVKNLPPKPDGTTGTPEPVNEDKDSKPLRLRIIETNVGGKRGFRVAQAQEGQRGQVVEVKGLQYREGNMVYFTGERSGSGSAKVRANYAIPLDDLMLAQLASEQDAILKDTGLSTEQRDLLNLANESFKKGMAPIRDAKAPDTLAEGARSAGLMTRTSIDRFLQARGASIPPDKLDRILDGNTVAKPKQMVEVMDAAGFFDKNQMKIMVQEAEAAVGTAQSAFAAAEQKVQDLTKFEGKAAGDKIADTASGTDIEVTQADIDSLVTAKNEYTAAQKALEVAIDELKELKSTESSAADPQVRGEIENYMNKIQNGEVSSESGLAFIRAMETNDAEGIFNAVMEEHLKKIADEQEREAQRKLMQEKYKKLNEKALKTGAIALMVLLMLMKDASK